MVKLYEHNLEAFQEINKMIDSGIKKIAVPRATGSGKTYLIGALAEKYNDDRKLVLEPTRPLLNSIKEKFDEFGITNTEFMTYQKLIRMSDEDIAAMDYKLIFLDEAHHGVAPVWGKKIDCLMSTHPDSIILGTSATTVRNDGVNVVETIFGGNAIGELPISTAIARKVLPCPHYITAIYRLDDEFEKLKKRIEASTNTKDEKQEFYRKMKTMKSHFEKSYGVPLILNKYIKVKNGKYLVFCKDRKQLDSMRGVVIDWFKTAGIKSVHSYAVYSDYPDKEKDYKDFQEDNSDSLKLLFSINMLNEGLHIEDISGVLMLRTTQSNLIYLQQLGRLLEVGNMGKYLLVFDFVNNFSSVNDGAGLLREIKDAVAKEKESNPDYDDSGFEDIDTFFVLEQIVEIQEMFREIEGRLKGSWDLMFQEYCKFYEENGHGDVPKTEEYRKLSNWCIHQRQDSNNGILKEERKKLLDENKFIWDVPKYRFENNIRALKQYKEREGDCLVPCDYVEVVNGVNVSLGNWCQTMRSAKKGKGKSYFIKEIEEQLEQLGFIWDVKQTNFENNVRAVSDYYRKYEDFPNKRSGDLQEKQLGAFWSAEKHKMNMLDYPDWKTVIIKKYLPQFSYIKNNYDFFDTFIFYIKRFKKEMNHVNIKYNDIIDGYMIGKKLTYIRKLYRQNKLSADEVEILKKLGINLKNGTEIQHEKKLRIAKDAIDNGFIVTYSNQEYKGVNLYHWIKWNKNKKLTNDEIGVIEKLTRKSIDNLFEYNKPILVMDTIKNIEVGRYDSQSKAAKDIQKKYGYNITVTSIKNCINKTQKTPYKGRFMFYYATDEEIKKHLEDGKAI